MKGGGIRSMVNSDVLRACAALECGSSLPLSQPANLRDGFRFRGLARDFNPPFFSPLPGRMRVESQPASWLVKKRQQAAAL